MVENFEKLSAGIESLATVAAIIIGGYWTYKRFIRHRENFAFIEFSVDLVFVGKQAGCWIVELIAILENKGKVQHTFCDLTFDLVALNRDDPVEASERWQGQAHFPQAVANGPWIPNGKYFIEAGLRSKYTYVARVPESASFLMLHGKFAYMDQEASHSAERTVRVPKREPDDNSDAHSSSGSASTLSLSS